MGKLDFQKALTRVAAVGAGAIASNVIGTKLMPDSKVKPAIRGAAKIAIGALLPMIAKGKTGELLANIGDGFVADGARDCAEQFMPDMVSGHDNISVGRALAMDEDYMQINGVMNFNKENEYAIGSDSGAYGSVNGHDDPAVSGAYDQEL